MMRRPLLGVLLACLAPAHVDAQSAPPAEPAAAPAQAPATVSVEDAYRRELAFLQAQRRELQASLERTRSSFQRDQAALERELSGLESRLLAARAGADQMAGQVAQVEEQTLASQENTGLLAATWEQAGSTLAGLGIEAGDGGFAEGQPDDTRLAALFAAATAELGRRSGIRREQGMYFLADGTEARGEIIHLGSVAAFAVGEQGSGALAPAGAGRFKLWPEPAQDEARALAAGRMPATLRAYLFESLAADAQPPRTKTLVDTVNDGGTIGWIIVALGALALVFVVLRALFLRSAGASTDKVLAAVAPLVQQRRFEDAIGAAKRHKGSSARVVTAALRNIDRDPEHLEDIVSESILHESGRLNRFGAIILVIAAVAPLLGLLGTVTGMIETFDIITDFGTGDPKLLSGGIAIALVTTQLGLVVAIPALLLGNLLSGWAERLKDDMEQAALRITNLAREDRAVAA
ncbi:MAG: MotA/TolQ/ExbB proton channel family protein [Xanthomonadales bacterium]|nr:MotA/TolQ/ExbB proton channel family protein [Xanthomonadales bacterium]